MTTLGTIKSEMVAWQKWTLVSTVVTAAFLGGMTVQSWLHDTQIEAHTQNGAVHETPDQKLSRVKAAVDPVRQSLDTHMSTPGHPVIMERVAALQKDLDEIQVVQRQILAELRGLKR